MPRALNFDFWETSKEIYEKLQNKGKVFKQFHSFLRFPEKKDLYSLTKFGILKSSSNIPWPRKFYLSSCQTPKQIYRKLQDRKKVFEEFSGLPGLSRKIVSYLPTKLDIIKPWGIILFLKRFDLYIWQISKHIYAKIQCKEEVSEEFQSLFCFSRKMVFSFVEEICHSKALNKHSMAQKIPFRLLTNLKANL